MFCSGCGTQLQPDLNYCNRCGRRVAPDSENTSIAANLSSSLGYIGGFGFLSFIFVALVLVKNGVPGNQIIPIAFFYFAALFGICFLIFRQTQIFSKFPRKHGPAEAGETGEQAAYLRPATTAQLYAATNSPASVTEHTTQTLENVAVERK